MPKIAVVGAGVIGLSSAIRILEVLPNAEITVFADAFSPHTTTDVSGGIWGPHLLMVTPKHLVREWSWKTKQYMESLAKSDAAKYTGATILSGYKYIEADQFEEQYWKDMVDNYRKLTEEELRKYPDMKHGVFYTTVKLDPSLYIQWLMKRLQQHGCHMQARHISSLTELHEEGFDVIVNCSGIGSKELVKDDQVIPVRGQVLRVIAPWLKMFFLFIDAEGHSCYVFPGTNFVVVGGVQQKGDWDLSPRPSDSRHIWDMCTRFLPSFKEATIEGSYVGLRPTRPTVRLELERFDLGERRMHVVHNYGHGGAGVTLHWGCAEDTARHVCQALVEQGLHSSSKL